MVSRWDGWKTVAPKTPMVVSETLDGDAIIMHHGTGCYFNAISTGALLWESVEQGATPQGLAERLVAACGISEAEAQGAAARFLDRLVEHDLVKPGEDLPGAVPPVTPMAFAEPELSVHEDLADMLLLDPVHDVDEAGWPAPKSATEQNGASWGG